jgi:hypothetical protein
VLRERQTVLSRLENVIVEVDIEAMKPMNRDDDIQYCQQRIAEEEAIARSTDSQEAGEMHSQMAMLYRAQLVLLKSGRA